jgi:hypothetical protein
MFWTQNYTTTCSVPYWVLNLLQVHLFLPSLGGYFGYEIIVSFLRVGAKTLTDDNSPFLLLRSQWRLE